MASFSLQLTQILDTYSIFLLKCVYQVNINNNILFKRLYWIFE